MDSKVTGKKIRALRHSAGMTLEQLAVALRIKKNMLSNYELGKSALSAELLTKIADFFDVSLDSLINRPNIFKENSSNGMCQCNVYSNISVDNFDENDDLNHFLHTVTLPEYLLGEGSFFGLKITDESLNVKNILRGSVVIARQQSVASPGSLVIYQHKDHKAEYGIYSFTDENIIISPCSFDSTYKPKIFKLNDEDFKIIGKVVWFLGPVI